MTDDKTDHPIGTVVRAHYADGSGSELALMTVTGWVGERGPIPRRAMASFQFEVLDLRPVSEFPPSSDMVELTAGADGAVDVRCLICDESLGGVGALNEAIVAWREHRKAERARRVVQER